MGKSSRRKRERPAEIPAAPGGGIKPDRPRGKVRPSTRSRWRALSLILLHVAIALHILHWRAAKTTLTPLEPSEVIQTLGQGLVNAGAILFALSILATMIFGRFFCGWGCHILALQDLCSWLLKRIGIRLRPFRSRVLILAPLAAAIFLFVMPTLVRLWLGQGMPTFRAHLYTDDFWARFPAWPIALFTFAVCGFGIVYLLGNKAFCTYACPYGGIFGLVEPLAPFRVRVTDACDGCGHCTATCTSNVRVHEEVRLHEMVVDPGCMRCTDCISVCPKDALYLGFGKPAVNLPPPRATPRPQADQYTRGEEFALAALFLVSVMILRKLYDAVPFLLALALAAISAHLFVTVWQLRRSPRVEWARWTLKQEGSLRRAGPVVVGIAVLWGAFLAHSAWIQTLTMTGAADVNAGVAVLESGGMDPTTASFQIERGVTRLERADRYGLATVGNVLGLIAIGNGQLGRDGAAESALLRAVEHSPGYAFAHLSLSHYAAKRGDTEGELDALRAAVAADPELPGAHEALVRALDAQGRRAEAATALEGLLRERPSSAEIRLSYGILLAHLDRAEEGIQQTRQVIEAEPDNSVAYYNLALLYRSEERYAEAADTCRTLTQLRSDSEVRRLCAGIETLRRSGAAPKPDAAKDQ